MSGPATMIDPPVFVRCALHQPYSPHANTHLTQRHYRTSYQPTLCLEIRMPKRKKPQPASSRTEGLMQFRERLWAALTPRERLAVLSAQAKPKLPPPGRRTMTRSVTKW